MKIVNSYKLLTISAKISILDVGLGSKYTYAFDRTISLYVICTSNHMFGRAIWDKLNEYIFENFEIAPVKRGQFQNFQKSQG